MGKNSLLFATLLAWLAPMETGAGSTCLIGNVFVCCAGYYYNTNSVCTLCPAGKAPEGGRLAAAVTVADCMPIWILDRCYRL